MESFGWAFDDGYSHSKSLRREGDQLIPWKVPSYKTGYRLIEQKDAFGNDRFKKNPDSMIAVEYDYKGEGVEALAPRHHHYLLGDCALEQDLTIQWNGSYDKHIDEEHFLSHFLAHMARYAQFDNDEIVLDPLLLMIPTEVYRDVKERENRKKRFENMLLDRDLTVTLTYGHHKFTRRCRVNGLEVYQQPFGAALDLMIGDDLARKPQYSKKYVAAIDWGGKTLQICLTNGIDEVWDYCKGFSDMGYYWVVQQLRTELANPSFGLKVTDGQAYRHITTGSTIGGYNIKPAVLALENQLFDNGINIIHTVLDGVFSMVDEVIFTGGTCLKFKEKLEAHFTGKKVTFGTEFTNVAGATKLAILKNQRRRR